MNETWCSLAWNHHFIGPGGNCKPCCRFKGQDVPDDRNLTNYSLDEIYNDDFITDIRQKMIDGIRIPGCAKCYEEQDAGKRASLREIYNRYDALAKHVDMDNPKIIFLESAFSNICDLQCVMCAPYFSTSWSKQDLTEIPDLIKPYGRMTIDLDAIKSIIPDIIHFKFTGGEPLLIPEYQKMLEERERYGGFEDVFLNYSTNLMRLPSQRLYDIWQKVKFIEIATSFDGVGKVIEYVRYPTKWYEVQNNLIHYMDMSKYMDIRVGMRSTIMPYNVLDLLDMQDWWIEHINKYYKTPFNKTSWVNPTHVAQPVHLTLKVLPKKAKQIIRESLWNQGHEFKFKQSFNHLCNYMDSEDHTHHLDDFKRFTKVMDKRGICFQEFCDPELYNAIF
jgi:sulfatase maturation enzyme AslB (radical SAM superfamily)